MDITFREYKEEDESLLLALSNKLEEFAKSLDTQKRIQNAPGFAELSLQETLENFRKYQGKIWFAQDHGNVIGYITGFIWEQSEANKLEIGVHTLGEVKDIYLEENYRGKGIGKTMLNMMEDYFKQKGCDSLWIQVFAPNTIAHTAYKKFGFVEREIGMLKKIQ